MPYYEVETKTNYMVDNREKFNKDVKIAPSFYAVSDEAIVRAFSIHGFWDYIIRDENGEIVKEVHAWEKETTGRLADFNPWDDYVRSIRQDPHFDEKVKAWDYRFEVITTLMTASNVGLADRREYDLLSYLAQYPRTASEEDKNRFFELYDKYNKPEITAFVNRCKNYSNIFGYSGFSGISS